MPDTTENLLQAILSDPLSSPEEKEQAQKELDALGGAEVAPEASTERTEGEDRLSQDAREMLLCLKLRPLALFMVSEKQLDEYCRKRHISGTRYDALYDEWWDYQLPTYEWLRLIHLADPATDKHWSFLAHWRGVLASPTKKRLVKQFAEQNIKMLSEYALVPAAVREAAGKFGAEYREGQPIPRIAIPGNEKWATMPHCDLYGRMVRLRELQAI